MLLGQSLKVPTTLSLPPYLTHATTSCELENPSNASVIRLDLTWLGYIPARRRDPTVNLLNELRFRALAVDS